MRTFQYLFILLPFISGFIRPETRTVTTPLLNKYRINNLALFDVDHNSPLVLENKINGFVNLTRINNNFIPTSVLIFLCGNIANPNGIMQWLQSPVFWSTFITIHLITAAGMVLNDIFDIKIDRINNPSRPLINGSIEVEEAIGIALLMVMTAVFLGNKIIPSYLSPYWIGSILLITIYTPLLKRVFLLKNLSCATLVSMTVPFVGLSVLDSQYMQFTDASWSQLILTAKMLFMSSMYIEILLDITDVEGDQANGINTLPVVLGKRNSLGLLFIMVFCSWVNIVWNLSLHPIKVLGMNIVFLPYFVNLWRTLRTNFSNNVVKNAVRQTNLSLFAYFILQIIS